MTRDAIDQRLLIGFVSFLLSSVKDSTCASPSFAGASAAHRGVANRIATMQVTVKTNFALIFL